MEHRDQMILRRLGQNLHAERSRNSLTQEQVADRMGVKVTQYSRMERGEHDTGITKFLKAAWAIGMTPDDLFRRLEDRMP
ncbi:MAG: hypothetical protein JWM98_2876 [Thermoleophilia bacterium]|nr:hypothetical protein [Thermoleophilia bacterium]